MRARVDSGESNAIQDSADDYEGKQRTRTSARPTQRESPGSGYQESSVAAIEYPNEQPCAEDRQRWVDRKEVPHRLDPLGAEHTKDQRYPVRPLVSRRRVSLTSHPTSHFEHVVEPAWRQAKTRQAGRLEGVRFSDAESDQRGDAAHHQSEERLLDERRATARLIVPVRPGPAYGDRQNQNEDRVDGDFARQRQARGRACQCVVANTTLPERPRQEVQRKCDERGGEVVHHEEVRLLDGKRG